MDFPRLVIGGTASGVGKTTVTLGLMGAFARRGYRVQGFKVGPDYIDPSHHTVVTGNPSRNLDTWMATEQAVLELFARSARHSDIAIIEGVMGLFDGYGPADELGSTAHLAKLLRAPVLLVIDAKAMARSAAAQVLGFKAFDPSVRVVGVIANNVSGERHFDYIRPAIEDRIGVAVLGYLPHDVGISITERHLGLVPEQEHDVTSDRYEKIIALINQQIDIDRCFQLAQTAEPLPRFEATLFGDRAPLQIGALKPVIAVARDEAFHFYYEDNLDLLRHYGAEIVFFSPLHDRSLPSGLDLIYLGGGFPELFAAELSENASMRAELLAFVETNAPVYAECGGLMYLGQGITTFEDRRFPMVGVLPLETVMQKRRMALGYAEVTAEQDSCLCRQGETFRGHEFHWSEMRETKPVEFVLSSSQRNGQLKKRDGIRVHNVLASYAHAYFPSNPRLAQHLVSAASRLVP